MKSKTFMTWAGILLAVSLLLYFVQDGIIRFFLDQYVFHYPIWKIYAFHFSITLILFALLYWVGKVLPGYVGFTFMGFILLRMVAALAFLFPLIKMEHAFKIPDFTSFFVPYFVFLFFEIVLTMKILNHSNNSG